MKKAGYKTAMYGKWHISGAKRGEVGNGGGVRPSMQGFDDVLWHPANKLGIDNDTVVVFLSDNGGPPQAPLRSWKGSFYEGGIRVPFVVRCGVLPQLRACWHIPIRPSWTVCATRTRAYIR